MAAAGRITFFIFVFPHFHEFHLAKEEWGGELEIVRNIHDVCI